MRHLLATTALPLLLAACATAEAPPPATLEVVSTGTVAAPTPPPAPKPEFGNYGFDETGMDRSVAPGTDFYNYANATWAKNTPIPADRSNYGAFNVLDDLSRERTHAILEAARAENSKIGVAYATYLDTATIEAKGLAPIEPWLGKVRALGAKSGYPALLAEADRAGIPVLFANGVGQDDRQPDVYAMFVNQAGIGMPDRDYYLSKDAKLVETRAAYVTHLTAMLALAGEANAAARANAILAFETGIARAHWTQVENRDVDRTYNKMTLAELAKRAPGFDFATYFRTGGADLDSAIVAQPSAIAGIARLVRSTPLGVLKDQLLVRSIETYADVLPSKVDAQNFAFQSTVLFGVPEQRLRWKRAVDFTVGAVTDEVSKLYVAKYFPPETKAAADELVQNVIDGMGRRIDQLDWMTPETKAKARAKLAAFKARIGYPDQWKDYSALRITAGDAFGNNWRANAWRHEYNYAKLGQPVRRWEWGLTPMDINAQANFNLVAITFPAAILQPPFFDPNADPAINYGAIGAVIGHEISHHFDDQGAKYNEEGRLTDWWTPADVAAFKTRTDALVAQYDTYEALPGMHVQGALTLGENVGDLAGLSAAYDAYKHSLGGKEAPVIDGTTGDQRFFLGWAQVWRRNYREAALRQRLLVDPHSPSIQRAWVVRNLDPWYAAFGAEAGQAMFLTPGQRVRIW